MAYVERGVVKSKRSIWRLKTITDFFWAIVNLIGVFFATMFSMEKSDAYKKGSASGKKWDGGGPGGPGGPYGGRPRGPPRGLDNVRGIDHSKCCARLWFLLWLSRGRAYQHDVLCIFFIVPGNFLGMIIGLFYRTSHNWVNTTQVTVFYTRVLQLLPLCAYVVPDLYGGDVGRCQCHGIGSTTGANGLHSRLPQPESVRRYELTIRCQDTQPTVNYNSITTHTSSH
ncbi:hypothetical protein DVH24_006855 [Malus domestica]|uniref:Uncharacterized protein n=1 Tax=Malus domestica TaxID=3750 RepID=A0A498J5Z1_MALDO|nr:hypothetical protein DVH24_006855 [Malus domestica]